MTDPIDLEALRAALAVIQRETVRAGGVSFSDGRDLIATHAAVSAALAELTTRRARDAEVGALVAKWREAASGIEEGCDDDDFLSDIEHDEAVAAAMFSCADDLESALLPFQRSDDKGDAT